MPFMFGGMRRQNAEEESGTMDDSTSTTGWGRGARMMMKMASTNKNHDDSSSSSPTTINKPLEVHYQAAREWVSSLDKQASSSSTDGSRQPSRQSELVVAVRDIIDFTRRWIASGEYRQTLHWLAWNVVIPLLLIIALCAVTFYVLHKIYRWLVPYSANELHQQALQTLQPTIQDRPTTQCNTRRGQQAEKQAESLFYQALERDPEHTSTWVSLSALYTYRREEPDKALSLLEAYQTNSFRKKNKTNHKNSNREQEEELTSQQQPERPLNAILRSIQEDAQAMKQGHKSMVQRELAETEHLTFFATLARSNK
eukprot:CAMPEP_0168728380 /NCGR_PEP_ID=MMETSP0724-20121128/5654_1 /TAXON_ID=265536 /ORGANISM="Amphiprora sp., Strain CCMP467" /LENGTH=311 /DNA_ID=CAMNT_0008775223 /DNA_START=15 /DNA_END=950 /DNA_ORIENTATION=-